MLYACGIEFTYNITILNKEQYLVTFLISSHPGCTMDDMIELAEYIRDKRMYTKQVQDFTPTPMTAATCMFHTELYPFTGKDVYGRANKSGWDCMELCRLGGRSGRFWFGSCI